MAVRSDDLCTFCGDPPVKGVRTSDGWRVCARCLDDPPIPSEFLKGVQ